MIKSYFFYYAFLFFMHVMTIASCSYANEMKSYLSQARKGHFIISHQGGMTSLLKVNSIDQEKKRVTIEEISCPKISLRGLLSVDAKFFKISRFATSWMLYEIDIESGDIVQCYNQIKRCFIHVNDQNYFSKLYEYSLIPLSEHQRKKIGHTSIEELDTRKIWNPSLKMNGKRIAKPEYNVYRLKSRNDDPLFKGKDVDLYFLKRHKFPFPICIDIRNQIDGSLNWHVEDAGCHEDLICSSFPSREPSIDDRIQKTEKSVVITTHYLPSDQSYTLFFKSKASGTLTQIDAKQVPDGQSSLIFIVDQDAYSKLNMETDSYSIVIKGTRNTNIESSGYYVL